MRFPLAGIITYESWIVILFFYSLKKKWRPWRNGFLYMHSVIITPQTAVQHSATRICLKTAQRLAPTNGHIFFFVSESQWGGIGRRFCVCKCHNTLHYSALLHIIYTYYYNFNNNMVPINYNCIFFLHNRYMVGITILLGTYYLYYTRM